MTKTGSNPPVLKLHTGTRFRLPILWGILPIRRDQVLSDVIAGATLAALAIPEVMGYTKISGTPVITGLYTLVVPMFLFALFGSSRHLVVGADSATAAILAGGLVSMATAGSAEWLNLAQSLALLAGALLAIARILRLGFVADFLSRTVLVGFLTGVGIQVALGEISGMLGLPSGGHSLFAKLSSDWRHLSLTNVPDLAVALAVIAVTLGAKRISRRIPGALIAVIAAIVLSWSIDLKSHGVHVLGSVPSGLPRIGLPEVPWSWELLQRLFPTAFAMSIVILAQSAATSRAYAARRNEQFSENLDMVGLALANFGAGLSGTFVVNGSPTKTQMVESAGGRTQLAQLTTTAIIFLVLLFLTKPLAYMPTAVLSAVVFLIGVELIDIDGMRNILAVRPAEFWVALITAAVVVLVGVEQGILLAIVLSLLNHTRHGYRPKNSVLVCDEAEGWRTIPVETPRQLRPGLMVYRFNHSMYYANSEQLSKQIPELASTAKPTLSWFCIDATAVDDVDYTAAATLRSLYSLLKQKSIRLVFVDVAPTVRAELDRYGLTDLFGKDVFYHSIRVLVSAYQAAHRQQP